LDKEEILEKLRGAIYEAKERRRKLIEEQT